MTIEQIKKKKIELTTWASRKLLALILMVPANWLGFSETYFPKYIAPTWFRVFCIVSWGMSMLFFFPKESKWIGDRVMAWYHKKVK